MDLRQLDVIELDAGDLRFGHEWDLGLFDRGPIVLVRHRVAGDLDVNILRLVDAYTRRLFGREERFPSTLLDQVYLVVADLEASGPRLRVPLVVRIEDVDVKPRSDQ